MFNWDKDHQIIDEWNHYSPPLSYKMLFFMFSIKTLRAEHRRPPEVRLSFSSSLTLGHPQRRRWGEVALLTERWNIRCSQARLLNPLLPPSLPPPRWKKRGSIFAGRSATSSPTPPGKPDRKEINAALCSQETVTRYEGGDQGWGEIGSRWLAIPWRLIPQGPAMRIWYW